MLHLLLTKIWYYPVFPVSLEGLAACLMMMMYDGGWLTVVRRDPVDTVQTARISIYWALFQLLVGKWIYVNYVSKNNGAVEGRKKRIQFYQMQYSLNRIGNGAKHRDHIWIVNSANFTLGQLFNRLDGGSDTFSGNSTTMNGDFDFPWFM